MPKPPLIIVIAGPNGAGKSTVASSLLPRDMTFVNADDVARSLPGYPSPAADVRAGRLVLEQMDRLAEARSDFAVETTLAGLTLGTRIARIRETGYSFRLVFVRAPSPEFCIARVAARVRAGGHHIPEETIRWRFEAGRRNLVRVYLPLADVWSVHDNSTIEGPRLIAHGGLDRETIVCDRVMWDHLRTGRER